MPSTKFTNIFASLVVRKISKPNHISSFYGKFVYKRKALHLFRPIYGFLQRTLRLGQSNFHLASVFPQNLMDRGSRKNWFVKKSRYRNRQDDVFEQLLHAAMTYIAPSVLGSHHSECQRLCNGKTKHVPVHDGRGQNSMILPIYRDI